MAYALKYWYEQQHEDGKIVRLEIYKNNSTASAMEIGDVVQGLVLAIDGGEDNLDAPIVSTTLTMTFVDAYDHPDADVKKCGNWAEFYTPDATLWKVILLGKNANESSFRTLWGGYVTPDSYQEELSYRGSITIVARDNINHMADFPFDYKEDLTLTLRDLVESAWAKIESPMSLVWNDEWLQCEGVLAIDSFVNASAFDNKSWRDAVEESLHSYGAVMRYIGNNVVKVCPLRYLPEFNDDVVTIEPTFLIGATRMLTPAAKRIEERAEYTLEASLQKLVEISDYTGETIEVADSTGFTGTVWPIKNIESEGWKNPVSHAPLYMNPSAYEFVNENIVFTEDEKELLSTSMLLLCNSVEGRAIFSKYISPADVTLRLYLGNRYYRASSNSLGKYNQDYCKAHEIVYAVKTVVNGITEYLQSDGSWNTTEAELVISSDLNISELTVTIPNRESLRTLLELEIRSIKITETLTSGYIVVNAFAFEAPSNMVMISANNVNTNYNEENNVTLSREPFIAPALNMVAEPGSIRNGIFIRPGSTYSPASAWAWEGGTPQQMAVYNHLQLLAYYAKPNNILEGSIVNADVTRMATIWAWEGKEHILVAGRFDMLTGFIDGAILREFARYEAMWEDVSGSNLPASETSNTTNIEAEASGSSGGSDSSTYESTTTVNINTGGGGTGASYLNDLLDVNTENVVAGSVLYFDGSEWIDRSVSVILQPIESRVAEIESWFSKEGETLKTTFNLASEKQVSSGGIAEEGSGGGDGSGSISGASDAAISNQQEGDIIVWQESTEKWVNKRGMYHHVQSTPLRVWEIQHNMGKFPNVKIVDSSKQLCMADVYYVDENNVKIEFGSTQSGSAYLD